MVIFKIDLNERNPVILRLFYGKSLFSIINIETIVEINYSHVLTSDSGFQNIILWTKIDDQRNEWLHNKMMEFSMNYQQQEATRTNDTIRRNHLAAYINEEEEIQRNRNNDNEHTDDYTSASPRFIAEFRLEGPKTLNTEMPEIKCTICLEQFQIGDEYSHWPCAGQHMLHHQCMLELLRWQNRCPTCRYTVEDAHLPPVFDMFDIFDMLYMFYMFLAREHQS